MTALEEEKRYVTYTGHSDYVNAVAWSPDGTRIASASFDETVQVWDATTGITLSLSRGHRREISAVAWSPDGKRIASGSEDRRCKYGEWCDNRLALLPTRKTR